MQNEKLSNDSVLRVGEVSGIDGRKVYITVDKNKNASDLLFDGRIIKNISVGSYIEIAKGFQSIIGKVDGEKLEKETIHQKSEEDSRYEVIDKNKRTLTVSLIGYIGYDGKYKGGIKELPLIGNEAYILTEEKIHKIHSLVKEDSGLYINIAKTDVEEIEINLPIDDIFNSHIALFGNTGSGKSNTLASLYQEMYKVMDGYASDSFQKNCKFLLFDFNGEYASDDCITENKKVYNLSTRTAAGGEKLILKEKDLLDIETFSILVEATEKTQKPFLKRALRFYHYISEQDDAFMCFKNILKKAIKDTLQVADIDLGKKLLDYLINIIAFYEDVTDLLDDIRPHQKSFVHKSTGTFLDSSPETIVETNLYKAADKMEKKSIITLLEKFEIVLHLQLIKDLYQYKVQNDHIYPVINRIKAKKNDICKIFETANDKDIWQGTNFIVINLHDVNLDMKKTIPLLISKKLYNEHKKEDNKKSLNVIVDEAHNILSKASFRETEEWKDYRLETFEEIIKEGRKYGVFMTISSQRPNDTSETIISQAHNYFIHQLINHKDLLTISNAVSYIDKITEESIPTLPVGTCIFSGIATPMPLKMKIDELPDENKPESKTLKFCNLIKPKNLTTTLSNSTARKAAKEEPLQVETEEANSKDEQRQ